MNNKVVYILISIIFVVIISASICSAADNTTTNDISDTESNSINDVENEKGSITDLNNEIRNSAGSFSLTRDYEYDEEEDGDFEEDGITLEEKTININGNNHTINMNGAGKLFTGFNLVSNISNLTIKNTLNASLDLTGSKVTTNHVTFINENNITNSYAVRAYMSNYNSSHDTFINLNNSKGTAINIETSSLNIVNATFNLENLQEWGVIYSSDTDVTIINTTFANMKSKYSNALYLSGGSLKLSNSKFNNLTATHTAGAIGAKNINKTIIIENCEFTNITSENNGGILYLDIYGHDIDQEGRVTVNNSTFTGGKSQFGGAILQLGGYLYIYNSTFLENSALLKGGAIYTSYTWLEMNNSLFKDNYISNNYEGYSQGGAIYFDIETISINNTKFENNQALEGMDVYMYDSRYTINNSNFTGNIHTMFDGNITVIENSTFKENNIINDTEYTSVYISNSTSTINYTPIIFNESMAKQEYFNLADYGLLSPVKNQGSMGSCWSFGVTSALESAFLKATNKTVLLDISENNIQNSGLTYFNYGIIDTVEGAATEVGISYMASWLGFTTSEDNTYDELRKISAIIDNQSKYKIYEGVILPARQNVSDNQYLKDALVKYGAVSVTVHGAKGSQENDYNQDTYAAYYNEEEFGEGGNHAVTLVGWNDTFSKSKFLTTPPGDGAWIIKNSWGSDWGDKGYYYVSYYDHAFATDGSIAFIVDANHTYQKNYQYDIITFPKMANYTQEASYSNKFTSTGDDIITAVGTYFNKTDANYQIKIYVNKELIHTQSGTSTHPGYETIKLDKIVPVKDNDEFTVEMTTGNQVPLARVSRQHYRENTSFIKVGDNITDISKNNTVVCLKAYTIADKSYMITTINGSVVQVQYFDQNGDKLAGTNVTIIVNGTEHNLTTNDEAIAVFNVTLPDGQYNVTVVNPINKDEYNTTITITHEDKELTLKIDTTTFTIGQNNITASIYQEDILQNNITAGKVAFKVNGKTLKDTKGKVIYAKVVNGQATIENYEIPQEWSKETTTIQAIYSGSIQCEKLSSEKTNITIKTDPTLIITPITEDIPTESNITLKAKIEMGQQPITTGKIVFKINGKTVKDENSKVIYAKVDSNGEVSVDYNIGNLKAGSYIVEAVFISSDYDRISSNTTMNVVKA